MSENCRHFVFVFLSVWVSVFVHYSVRCLLCGFIGLFVDVLFVLRACLFACLLESHVKLYQ